MLNLKTKKEYFLFYLSYSIYALAVIANTTVLPYVIGASAFSTFTKIVRYIAYLLIVIKIIGDHYKLRQLILFGCIGLLFLFAGIKCGNNILITSYLFILGVQNLNFEKILQFCMVLMTLCMIIVVSMSVIGILPNWYYLVDDRERWCFGYIYPSYLSSAFFYIMVLSLTVKKHKINLLETIIVEVINLIIYIISDSRAAFYLLSCVIIVYWLIDKVPVRSRFRSAVRFVSVLTFPICTCVSFIVSTLYGKYTIIDKINIVLNNRPKMAHQALQEFGVSLWGQEIKWIGYGGLGYIYDNLPGEYNFVDNSYMKILFDYGLVILLIVVICFTFGVWSFSCQKNDALCLALMFVAIYSVIEPRLMEFGYNPFILSICTALITISKMIKNNKFVLKSKVKYEAGLHNL